MKVKSFNSMLGIYFEGYKWMARKRQKSAKKRRVVKKWIKRFGPDCTHLLAAAAYNTNLLLERIPKDSSWKSGCYQIPIIEASK